jgi:hypothetical protein
MVASTARRRVDAEQSIMRKSELRSFIWRAEADALLTAREACFGLRRRFFFRPWTVYRYLQRGTPNQPFPDFPKLKRQSVRALFHRPRRQSFRVSERQSVAAGARRHHGWPPPVCRELAWRVMEKRVWRGISFKLIGDEHMLPWTTCRDIYNRVAARGDNISYAGVSLELPSNAKLDRQQRLDLLELILTMDSRFYLDEVAKEFFDLHSIHLTIPDLSKAMIQMRQGCACHWATLRTCRCCVWRARASGRCSCGSSRCACAVPGPVVCAHSAVCALQCSGRACLLRGECWRRGSDGR